MGSFNALSDFIHRGDDHYSAMLHRIQSKIDNGTKCIESITTGINEVVMEDEKTGDLDIYGQSRSAYSKTKAKSTKLRRVQQIGYQLVSVLNEFLF